MTGSMDEHDRYVRECFVEVLFGRVPFFFHLVDIVPEGREPFTFFQGMRFDEVLQLADDTWDIFNGPDGRRENVDGAGQLQGHKMAVTVYKARQQRFSSEINNDSGGTFQVFHFFGVAGGQDLSIRDGYRFFFCAGCVHGEDMPVDIDLVGCGRFFFINGPPFLDGFQYRNVFDLFRIDGQRIVREDREVGQLSFFDGAFCLFFKVKVGPIDGEGAQSFHRGEPLFGADDLAAA